MQATPLRVLVLGGSGVFGSRVARLIAGDPNIEVILGGRDLARAEATAQDILSAVPGAKVSARAFDRDELRPQELREAGIGLVIHAAGPFQGQDYSVARTALAAGAHYLDLADDRSFVTRFDRLNDIAKGAKRAAISGLSSVPAISSAAVSALGQGLNVSEIRIGITPGNRAPRGLAVIAGILSGAGQVSEQRKGGAWLPVRGWQDLHRRTLKVSGQKTLRRWFSHVEVPDPDLLLTRYPNAETITFHAGLELSLLHLGLWLLTWPVRWRWIKNLAPFTRPLAAIAHALRWAGSDQGGMFVEVTGRDAAGNWLRRTWTVHAKGGDGPMIPAIPAAVIAKSIAAGDAPRPGARAAVGAVSLQAIEDAFAPFAITTERQETALPAPLFEQILGEKLAALPAAVRNLHSARVALRYEGEASVTRGTSALAGLLAGVLGLPDASDATPVAVMIEPQGDKERWTRSFGRRKFATTMGMTERKGTKLLTEQIGALRVAMAIDVFDDRLSLRVTGARWLGVPLPKSWWPRIEAHERDDKERFAFDVRVSLPLAGLVVHYKGWLLPVSAALRSMAVGRLDNSPALEAREPSWPR